MISNMKKSSLAKDEFYPGPVSRIWRSGNKLCRKYFSRDRIFIDYGYRIGKSVIQAAFLVLCTACAVAVLLYLCRAFWMLYTVTPAGKIFLKKIVHNKQIILEVLNQNFITFSLEITIAAFLVCLVLTAFFQFVLIARYFYFPRRFLGKTFFWGFCMTAAVATDFQSRFEFDKWDTAFIVALVPTLCVVPGCSNSRLTWCRILVMSSIRSRSPPIRFLDLSVKN